MFGGILIAFIIAALSTFLGNQFSLVGGPVFGIIIGLIVGTVFNLKNYQKGIKFTSKKILQYAIIVLGFSLNFNQVMKLGIQSLPIIITTIVTGLTVSYVVSKWLKIPQKSSTLIGVGSSNCGRSAIAATSSVIDADDQEIATAISVIFIFNIIAALVFPNLGAMLAMTNEGFGMFAGTAINDTSSVTASASIWDSINGGNSLEIATIVKLTRTLAIIPITLALAFWKAKKDEHNANVKISKIFPYFILIFLLASIITSVIALPVEFVSFTKTASKFMIVMAMSAIGLNTNIVNLVKSGAKPVILGGCCSLSIIAMSLLVQNMLGLW